MRWWKFQIPGGSGSSTTGTTYISLPHDEDEDEEEGKVGSNNSQTVQTRTRRQSQVITIRRALSLTFHIAVALLALYGFAVLVRPLLPLSLSTSTSTSLPATTLSCNCGETVAEARAAGCVYDSLAAAWLPPHCRSAAITAEFEAAGPLAPDQWGNTWGYWADRNRTRALTVEEVSMLPESARQGGPAHFFATHEWHVLHCVYYWRKMWEAGQREKQRQEEEGAVLVIEKRYDTLMHIQHCMTMLMKKGVDPDSVAAEAGVALHSDEIHIAKPHRHEDDDNDGDPYDKKGGKEEGEIQHEQEQEHEHGHNNHPDPYDEEKEQH